MTFKYQRGRAARQTRKHPHDQSIGKDRGKAKPKPRSTRRKMQGRSR